MALEEILVAYLGEIFGDKWKLYRYSGWFLVGDPDQRTRIYLAINPNTRSRSKFRLHFVFLGMGRAMEDFDLSDPSCSDKVGLWVKDQETRWSGVLEEVLRPEDFEF